MAEITAYRIAVPFRRKVAYGMRQGFLADWDVEYGIEDKRAGLFDVGDLLVIHCTMNIPQTAYHHIRQGRVEQTVLSAPTTEQLSKLTRAGLIQKIA